MLYTPLTRRCVASLPLLALVSPQSAPAASQTEAASLRSLLALQSQLQRCEQLVQAQEWGAAAAIVKASEFEPESLSRVFDGYTQRPSAQETAMNNAAFIVYYEERRYGDTRLEPKEPGLRAKQNGFKREAITAIDDLRAELRFFEQEQRAGRRVDDDADMRRFVSEARRAVDGYVALAKPEDLNGKTR